MQWFALCLHSGESYNREVSMAAQNQPEPSLRSQNCMSKRSYQYRKRIRLPIISMLSKCSANFNATCKSFHKPISRINAQSAYKTHKAAPKQVSPKLQRALVTEVFKFPKSPWSTASSSSQHLARTRCRVSTRKASTSCKLTNWVQGFLPLHRNVARGSLTQ